MAEHASLADNASRGIGAEPSTTCEALATSIVLLARSLRATIDSYCAAPEHVYGDRDAATDDDFPF